MQHIDSEEESNYTFFDAKVNYIGQCKEGH